jgi:hypothetical protein
MFLIIAGSVYVALGLLVALAITRAARESDVALEHAGAKLETRTASPVATPVATTGATSPAPTPAPLPREVVLSR